MLEVYLLPS